MTSDTALPTPQCSDLPPARKAYREVGGPVLSSVKVSLLVCLSQIVVLELGHRSCLKGIPFPDIIQHSLLNLEKDPGSQPSSAHTGRVTY